MSNQLNPHEILIVGLTALQVTQYARAQEFSLPGDDELDAPPGRFGPLAEELADLDPRLAVGPPGGRRVSLDTVAGMAWAAAAIAGDQIGGLIARATAVEARTSDLESSVIGLGALISDLDARVFELETKMYFLDDRVTQLENQLAEPP